MLQKIKYRSADNKKTTMIMMLIFSSGMWTGDSFESAQPFVGNELQTWTIRADYAIPLETSMTIKGTNVKKQELQTWLIHADLIIPTGVFLDMNQELQERVTQDSQSNDTVENKRFQNVSRIISKRFVLLD